MKTTAFAFAALLGLGLSTSAFAQTVPATPGTMGTTTGAPMTPGTVAPGTVAPGQVGTTSGTVPSSTINGSMTTPAGVTPAGATPGTVYSPGNTTVPNATLDATQPVGTSPATPGAARRATTGSRTTTGGRTTAPKTVRP
jgi:hypothetical protein